MDKQKHQVCSNAACNEYNVEAEKFENEIIIIVAADCVTMQPA
jgi:hypothetical protein